MAVFRGVIPLLWEILPISTQLALVASADGTIKFWDLSTNTVLRSLVGHTGAVIGLALRKEGKEIVSVSWDRTVRLWDFETGSEVSTLHGHTDGVVDVDVEEPGSRALTSSYDGTVRMWNLETGETLDVFTGHNGGIMAVRALSNWNAMITASDDMTLRLWNLRVPKRKTQKVLRGPVGSVWNIIFVDEDERIGTHVISVGEDPVMRLWNLKTGQSQEYKGHTDAVCGATILNKGKWVASVSDDGTVRLWDLQSATELAVLHVPEIPQCIASLSERSFAIGDTDGNLQVIEIAGAREGTDI